MMQSIALTDSCQHDDDFVFVDPLIEDTEFAGVASDCDHEENDNFSDDASYDYCDDAYSLSSMLQAFPQECPALPEINEEFFDFKLPPRLEIEFPVAEMNDQHQHQEVREPPPASDARGDEPPAYAISPCLKNELLRVVAFRKVLSSVEEDDTESLSEILSENSFGPIDSEHDCYSSSSPESAEGDQTDCSSLSDESVRNHQICEPLAAETKAANKVRSALECKVNEGGSHKIMEVRTKEIEFRLTSSIRRRQQQMKRSKQAAAAAACAFTQMTSNCLRAAKATTTRTRATAPRKNQVANIATCSMGQIMKKHV